MTAADTADCGCNFCQTGERDGLGHDDGPAAPRLPEPDFWLIGFLNGTPSEQERAEWHDQWHLENPGHPCDDPSQPRSSSRPGRLERLRRSFR